MSISVLMVVRNEQAQILSCLRSLLKQTLKPREVLIVDHYSEDQTFSIIKNFQAAHPDFNLKVVQRGGNHLGRSRQELLGLSQGPYVAFIDGDCEAPKNWLKTLYDGLLNEISRNPQVVGVGGPNRLPLSTEVHRAINLALDTALGSLSGSPQALKPKSPKLVNHLATTNCLFVKSALFKVGGFSAQFAAYGEDLDLGLRLTEKGYALLLLPEPVVTNYCAKDFAEWLSRMFRFGKAHADAWRLKSYRGAVPWGPLLLFPFLMVFVFASVFAPALLNLLAVYVLLSLVYAFLISGLRVSTRLGLPFWLTIHLSPLFHSMGLWQVIGAALREHLMANVFAHLKGRPAHLKGLLVGMFQRFFNVRPDSN